MANSTHSKIFPQLKSYARLNSLTDRVDVAFYDVEFYPFSEPDVDPVFAVVGGPEAIVCRPLPGENGGVEVIAWFHDDEPGSNLNSVTWSQHHETGDPLLIVSGTSPIIKIFDVKANSLVRTLVGHGKGINDLAVSPTSPQILASASMDKSVRFWNLEPKHAKQPTVLICGGEGHKESILTFAFHPTGRFLLTGGMDHIINLWLLPDLPDAQAGTDHPVQIRYPHFTSSAIHTDYVDCVAWYGDLILSKCAREHTVVLWRIEGFSSTEPLPDPFFAPTTHEFRPTRSAWNGSFQRLLEFSNPDCDLFFIRFTLYTGPPYVKKRPSSRAGREPEYMSPYAPSSNGPSTNGASSEVIPARDRPILAVGNEKSKISFWDLSAIETWSGEPDDEPLTKTGKKRGRPSKHGDRQGRGDGHGRDGHASRNASPASALAARNRRKEALGLRDEPSPLASSPSAAGSSLTTHAQQQHQNQTQTPHPLSTSHVPNASSFSQPGTPAQGSASASGSRPGSGSASGQTSSLAGLQPGSTSGLPHQFSSAMNLDTPSARQGPGSSSSASTPQVPVAVMAESSSAHRKNTSVTMGMNGPGSPSAPPSASTPAGPSGGTSSGKAAAEPSMSASTSTAASASAGTPTTTAAPAAPAPATPAAPVVTPSFARAASKFARTDPFTPLAAHRSIPIPKTTFAVRAIAWSNDGGFAVGVGDQGVVALFSR